MPEELDNAEVCKIHLLDVGRDEYGDAVLCQFGKRTVLIDGAHPGDHDGTPGHLSIPEQIETLLGANKPYPIDLLIITHAHQDHIGCLPRLIKDGLLKVGWILTIDPRLGWGRAGGEDSFRDADKSVANLAAALREEVRFERGTRDFALNQFFSDAVSLETSYKQMLETLQQSGAKVIKFGNPNADITSLENEFSDINLKILGPGNAHLLECADQIGKKTRDSVDLAQTVLKTDAAGTSEADAYRRIIGDMSSKTDSADSVDAAARPGPFINLQSIITQFEYAGHKFLFAGDFQFADPQTKNEVILAGVEEAKAKIKTEAPYSFVKLSHHGSSNAFSEEMLADLGETKNFGLCAGEASTHHPAQKILKLLDKNKDKIRWARTDHNGTVTLIFKKNQKEPKINIQKGVLNDAKPNFIDLTASLPAVAPPPSSSFSSGKSAIANEQSLAASKGEEIKEISENELPETVSLTEKNNFIEFTAKIPHAPAEISFSGNFTIKIKTDDQKSKDNENEPAADETDNYDASFLIGGGRGIMRDLLFVTSAEKLTENIGQSETKQILQAFEKQGIPVYSELPSGVKKSAEAAGYVRQKLSEYPNIRGVVIIGGFDAVPAQILDSLPTNLRNSLPQNDDPDNFIIWNDEIYGDRDGDGLPEIPVSRIPDGRSAKLVYQALQAGESRSGNAKFGIRNIYRPFAVDIFNKIPGSENLHISKDTVFDQQPPLRVEAEQVYFMLHGDYRDSSRFWGEETPSNREAFHVYNLPDSFRGVVFAGCCWGALTVDTPAGRTYPNRPFSLNTVESSIALSFLERGANAFVGCTGAHYSPTEPPFDYFGGPFHAAFWHFYNAGYAPAEALFKAKLEYIRQMPHGRTSVIQQAIEYKILRQFTCLGLGW